MDLPAELAGANWKWQLSGSEAFAAMLEAINAATQSVRLECYIFQPGSPGERFRDALLRARQRGAKVRVLIDALGSYGLPSSFWDPVIYAGGEVRRFNPLALDRLGIRNHRKVLVCDDRVGFVGGFNIAPEYEGDGVKSGWRDLGIRLTGPLVANLANAFDAMFERADFRHKAFARLRKPDVQGPIPVRPEQLLLSGPGRGRSPIKKALRRDLSHARSVQMMVAYFLPTLRLRRQLGRIARRGGHVRLILAGKSDVALSQLAGRSLYRRLLRTGIEIFEYQPQVLHAKLLIIDDKVYVGSANMDQRSLNINYELMVRFERPEMAAQAREVFAQSLQHCRQVTPEGLRGEGTFWTRLKQRWAYFLLVRIDPYIARHQYRAMPD